MAISVYTEDYLQRPLPPSGSRSKSLHLNISNLEDDNTVFEKAAKKYSHMYVHPTCRDIFWLFAFHQFCCSIDRSCLLSS